MNDMLYEYDGKLWPQYLKEGNACRFIAPVALQFCKGRGLDVCSGPWPLPGAIPIDAKNGGDAIALPAGPFDYIFSSHGLEHLDDPVFALAHWKNRLRPGGVLFLHLPHKSMTYWRPSRCHKHRHAWEADDVVSMVADLGFVDIIHSTRDLTWSFSVVCSKPE